MKRLYEFQCPSHGVFEEYTEYTKQYACPSCGELADKIISNPQVKLEGISGAFPGASMAWERKHKQKLEQERKKASS